MSDDLTQIQRLAADYCWHADHRDVEGIVSLFTEDAVFDARPVGLSQIQGRAALREFFGMLLPLHEYSQHLSGNHRIDLDKQAARGTCYYLMQGAVRGGAPISAAGYYEDTYVRTSDGWRIASRRGVPLGPPRLAPMTDRLG